MNDTPKHSVSVAGVVVDDEGRVLAIKRRDNGHWEPPGGVLELWENFEEGVRREVSEETGVTVKVERLTGAYKNMERGIVALVFLCRPVSQDPRPSNESEAVCWLPLDEVVHLMNEAYSVRVTDALTDRAHYRAHDGTRLIGH